MTKLNPIELYQEAGRKAGIARNRHDESRARFESDWANRAIRLECDTEHKLAARRAFNDAYTAARKV